MHCLDPQESELIGVKLKEKNVACISDYLVCRLLTERGGAAQVALQ